MLRRYFKVGSPLLVAALAIVTVAGVDEALATTVGLDLQLSDDPAHNMSYVDDGDWPGLPPPPNYDEPPPIGPPPKPPCEVMWTCDWATYYPTRAACGADCGGAANCAQDFNCDGSCICQ